MTKYSVKISFSAGERGLRYSVKAVTATQAERQARMLLNKMGKRPTSIEITER